MQSDPPVPKKRLRFSLATVLLAMTLLGLTLTVAMLYRELVPLRKEVARLRDEVGELNLGDRSQLHAIRVDTDNELEWKWRVWIPPGTVYRVRAHGGPVAKEGFPGDGGTVYIHDSGEHMIRYRVRFDPKDNRWEGALETRGASVGADDQPWVEWPSKSSTSEGVGKTTQAFKSDQPVLLIRHRVSKATSSSAIEDPAAGFMIWLERQ